MRLSISSSRQRPRSSWGEGRVIAFVVAVLLVVEVGIRQAETVLSYDIKNHLEFDDLAIALAESSRRRVLVLGNSMVRRGLNRELMVQEAARIGLSNVEFGLMSPDDASINDWPYIYHRYFTSRDREPDVLVLAGGMWALHDRVDPHPERIGRFYLDPLDIPDSFWRDVPAFGDRVDVGLSWLSRSFANRQRVKRRLLAETVPHYEVARRFINETQKNQGVERPGPKTASDYSKFQRFVAYVRGSGISVFFVPMPTVAGSTVDPGFIEAAATGGADIVSAPNGADMPDNYWHDTIHLSEEGRRVYTPLFVRHLAPYIEE